MTSTNKIRLIPWRLLSVPVLLTLLAADSSHSTAVQAPPKAAPSQAQLATLMQPLGPRNQLSISLRDLRSGEEIFSHHPQQRQRIASLSKLFTAATALSVLGPDYRFVTDFYGTDVVGSTLGTLYIKGWGDPLLLSETWQTVVLALPVDTLFGRIVVDDSAFAPGIDLIHEPGVSNPYNAPNAAFATNFNTLEVQLQGHLVQGEAQTPLTDFTIFQLQPTERGLLHVDSVQTDAHLQIRVRGPFATRRHKLRFHLGRDPRTPALYAGHLFAAMFRNSGGVLDDVTVERGSVPADAQLLYRHYSERDLRQTLKLLLRYSNNFVANQIFLVMGAEQAGYPAQAEQSQNLLQDHIDTMLEQNPKQRELRLFEGSGLDPRNQATARAMTLFLQRAQQQHGGFVDLLSARDTAPSEVEAGGRIVAKTGTYPDFGVRAMAGYLCDDWGRPYLSFALLCDGPRCRKDSFVRYDKALLKLRELLPPPARAADTKVMRPVLKMNFRATP